MTTAHFTLSVAVLLLIAATLTLALAATDVQPCGDECRVRFDGKPGVCCG